MSHGFCDELCDLVDKYILLNTRMLSWCYKNNVNPSDFVCNVADMDVVRCGKERKMH